MDRVRKNFYLFTAVILCLVTVPIAFGSFVTDCINIHFVKKRFNPPRMPENWVIIARQEFRGMLIYGSIDLVLCLVALISAVGILLEIKKVSSRYFHSCDEFRSKSLIGLGLLLSFCCVLKFCLWVREIVWLRNMGSKAKFLFLHYTLDEPTWNAIFILSGVLVLLVGLRGTRILMYSSLALTSLTAVPALTYLWIDYRWASTMPLTKVSVALPKPDMLLDANIMLGVIHLLIILYVILVQIRKVVKAGTSLYDLQLNTEPLLRKSLAFAGLLLLAAGFAFLVTDIVNLLEKSFFRIFYATEQKLPFVLLTGGVLCLLSLRRNMALYFIPTSFVVLLVCFHGTIFHISSYLFLSHQSYFGEHLCALFYEGESRCTQTVERLGTWSHFFEAAMAVSVFMLSLFAIVVLARIMRLYKLTLQHMNVEEQKDKKFYENLVLVIGIATFCLGLIVFCASIFMQHHPSIASHPLIILHVYIYRSCLALTLVIYPIVQIFFARNLIFFPMRSLALIAISLLRFIDILLQLDYRNVTHTVGSVPWTLLCVVELLDLALHFATMCACASLIDISIHRLPQFDFGDQNGRQLHSSDDRLDHNNLFSDGIATAAVNTNHGTAYTSFKPLKTVNRAEDSDYDWNGEIDDDDDGLSTARGNRVDGYFDPNKDGYERTLE